MGEGRGEGDPMKIFNSIKWRLQIWYGLILVLVLVGFGFTAINLERERQMTWLMTNLEQRFGAVAGALHPHPPKGPRGERPEEMPPQDLRSEGFYLPQQFSNMFDSSDPHNFFFVVFRDGDVFAKSTNALIYHNPNEAAHQPHQFGIGRPLPSGEMIYVGCSTEPDVRELESTALKLAVAGVVILFFGLAGGWWFVSRALRSVENISAAAVKISAGDLSQRINVAEAESELGQLAAVLNSTFARLESAFAQQKQFASDAAHELRTPVAVILTQTQTALNRERDAASYRETVEACQRAAQRMRKLIKSLLELARLDAGQEKLKRLQFDFSKTVEDCVELIRPIAEERRVKIISEFEPLEISGDSERLAQVVTNLLTNAIQYNRDGGEVRVKLKIKNGFAALKVSDTGAGIPAEDLPHVFKRFYRGDKSRTGSGNAGLGLAISKAIVEAHGGTIEVASKEDAGATFRVELPLL
jgi:two-component system OmpR family sensor kinase